MVVPESTWAGGFIAKHYQGKSFRDHSVIVESFLIVSYGTRVTSVAAMLTAAVTAGEYDLGECMEVCKRERRSGDTVYTPAHPYMQSTLVVLVQRHPMMRLEQLSIRVSK